MPRGRYTISEDSSEPLEGSGTRLILTLKEVRNACNGMCGVL